MLVSILHRATGTALAVGGGIIFAWWIAAAATGPKSYATFYSWVIEAQPDTPLQRVTNYLAVLVGIGLSWALFQHMASGVRHFVLDVGAGYELRANRTGAWATIAVSLCLTVAFWMFAFWSRV